MRYAVSGEAIHCAYCHCVDCRRATGAPVAAFAGYRDADLTLEGDEPTAYSAVAGIERLFCSTCGSPIGYRDARLAGETYLLAGAFDDPSPLAPERHAYAGSRVAWFDTRDDLPRHEATSRQRP
ncbi:MAG: GFA family protein [Paracoccaceae bacterium]